MYKQVLHHVLQELHQYLIGTGKDQMMDVIAVLQLIHLPIEEFMKKFAIQLSWERIVKTSLLLAQNISMQLMV